MLSNYSLLLKRISVVDLTKIITSQVRSSHRQQYCLCRSKQIVWNNSFRLRSLFLGNKSNSNSNHQQQQQKPPQRTIWSWDIVTSILVLFGVIEETKDSPLILLIKKGILAKQRKQYHKAEMFFHTALQMAQDLSYEDAETYIFDMMADNYFEKGDYQRARDLFLEVISRLSRKENFAFDGEELVEISIKLAYCFGQLGQIESSENGFQFSIATQLKRTDQFWNNKQSKLTEADMLDDSQ